jgi:hypothetical protein
MSDIDFIATLVFCDQMLTAVYGINVSLQKQDEFDLWD